MNSLWRRGVRAIEVVLRQVVELLFGRSVDIGVLGEDQGFLRRVLKRIKAAGEWSLHSLVATWRRYDDILTQGFVFFSASTLFGFFVSMQSYARVAQDAGSDWNWDEYLDWLGVGELSVDPLAALGLSAALAFPLFIAVQFQDSRASARRTASILELVTFSALWFCSIAVSIVIPLVAPRPELVSVFVLMAGFVVWCSALAASLRKSEYSARRSADRLRKVAQVALDEREALCLASPDVKTSSSWIDRRSNPEYAREVKKLLLSAPRVRYLLRSLSWALAWLLGLLLWRAVLQLNAHSGEQSLGFDSAFSWSASWNFLLIAAIALALELFYSYILREVRLSLRINDISSTFWTALLGVLVLLMSVVVILESLRLEWRAGILAGLILLLPALIACLRRNSVESTRIMSLSLWRISKKFTKMAERIENDETYSASHVSP